MKFSIHCNYSQLNDHSFNCYLIIIYRWYSVYAQIVHQYAIWIQSNARNHCCFFFNPIYVRIWTILRWATFSTSAKTSCVKCLERAFTAKTRQIGYHQHFYWIFFFHLHSCTKKMAKFPAIIPSISTNLISISKKQLWILYFAKSHNFKRFPSKLFSETMRTKQIQLFNHIHFIHVNNQLFLNSRQFTLMSNVILLINNFLHSKFHFFCRLNDEFCWFKLKKRHCKSEYNTNVNFAQTAFNLNETASGCIIQLIFPCVKSFKWGITLAFLCKNHKLWSTIKGTKRVKHELCFCLLSNTIALIYLCISGNFRAKKKINNVIKINWKYTIKCLN